MRRQRAAAPIVAALLAAGALAAPAAARSPEVTFYLGLQRPEAAARAAFWAVQAPSSPTYRRFLGVGEVARRYGASRQTIAALRQAARRHGLKVGVDRSGVFARVTARVPRLERVFRTTIHRSFDNDVLAETYFVPRDRPPRLPRDMRGLVREVVPVYARSARAAAGSAARASAAPPPPAGAPLNAGTWAGGCEAARRTGAYSFDQVRHAYGLDSLRGAGGSVAIVNLGEGLAAADIAANARCFGLAEPATRTLLTDGQARPFGRGGFEPQEDLALVRGMAPGLRSLTFAQGWLATELWFLAPAEVLAAPRLPDTLSISYGQCERSVRGPHAPPAQRAGADLFDALAVRLGLAGVGSFASAGDFGSTCNGQPFAGVAWPASSPFLTAVGGTRLVLDPANERTEEVVWNDTAWTSAEAGGGAGGGGYSYFSHLPPYQRSLGLAGERRSVPDVAGHASMFPGWPVVLAGHWEPDGGTSASAPLMAGAFAALSASERAAGRPPLGPVNSLLYALRQARPESVFDVTAGDNAYSAKVAPRFAGPGYDLASGLGVPRFDRILAALPAALPLP